MLLLLVVMAVGCGAKVQSDGGDAAIGPGDAGVDTFVPAPEVAVDTFVPGPPDPRVPVTFEQAGCYGLTAPVCVGCHRREGVWYLRPKDVPPPPSHPAPGGIDCGLP